MIRLVILDWLGVLLLPQGYNLELIDYVKEIKSQGIYCSILSNGGSSGVRNSPHIDLFDVVLCSAEVGLAKPYDAEFYKMAPDELAVPYAQCVMVDDLPQNLE